MIHFRGEHKTIPELDIIDETHLKRNELGDRITLSITFKAMVKLS